MADDILHGPTELILVRHGESRANVAASEAERSGAEVIIAERRDPDVELSDSGVAQAAALGRWLATRPQEAVPVAVWASPYERAARTAAIALETSGVQVRFALDERLRDRDLGVTDLLTTTGVRVRLPLEAARREWLGKFYYRPPGGESWTDLALRVRSFLDHLDAVAPRGPVMLVAHDAVVLTIRYVCEGLSERDVLAIGVATPVANASVTRLTRSGRFEPWTLARFNDVSHLTQGGAPITRHDTAAQAAPETASAS